jgi:hypothetical protein
MRIYRMKRMIATYMKAKTISGAVIMMFLFAKCKYCGSSTWA